MKIYLVENCGNCPGRIMACFAAEKDARSFAEQLDSTEDDEIVERTLFYGQPSNRGFNK